MPEEKDGERGPEEGEDEGGERGPEVVQGEAGDRRKAAGHPTAPNPT